MADEVTERLKNHWSRAISLDASERIIISFAICLLASKLIFNVFGLLPSEITSEMLVCFRCANMMTEELMFFDIRHMREKLPIIPKLIFVFRRENCVLWGVFKALCFHFLILSFWSNQRYKKFIYLSIYHKLNASINAKLLVSIFRQ